MKIFWLNVTNNCNLNCVYCYQSLRNSKNMSIETADKIISEISKINDSISINFFGGEPFINYDVIKHIVGKLNELHNKDISYSVTTNLTVLTDEIIDFIIKNNINVCSSFDGTEESFNLTRFNKYNNVNYFKIVENNLLKFKEKNYKKISIIKVISEHNYQYLYNDIVYLSNYDLTIHLNFDRNISSFNQNIDLKLLEHNLRKIFKFYIASGKKNITLFNNLELAFKSLFLCDSSKMLENSCSLLTCNNLNNMIYSYDIDGFIYPCHQLNEIYYGNMDEIKSVNIEELESKINNTDIFKPLNDDEKYDYLNERFISKECTKCKYNYFCCISDIFKNESCCYFKRYEFRINQKNDISINNNQYFCDKKCIFDLLFEELNSGGYELNDII